jgi:hypothetical protein
MPQADTALASSMKLSRFGSLGCGSQTKGKGMPAEIQVLQIVLLELVGLIVIATVLEAYTNFWRRFRPATVATTISFILGSLGFLVGIVSRVPAGSDLRFLLLVVGTIGLPVMVYSVSRLFTRYRKFFHKTWELFLDYDWLFVPPVALSAFVGLVFLTHVLSPYMQQQEWIYFWGLIFVVLINSLGWILIRDNEQSTNSAPGRRAISELVKARSFLRGQRPEKPLFESNQSDAAQSAANRRSFLTQTFRSCGRSAAPFEIIEIPPGYGSTAMAGPLDELSAAAQMVQLLYQASSQQALLFARVTDALISIWRSSRNAQPSGADAPDVQVTLRPLRWWEKNGSNFPWVAVIRTDHPEIFEGPLLALRQWLGIGVNFRPAVRLELHRGCARSEGRGAVAGFIRSLSKGVDYALTCAHVIPETCDQTRIYVRPIRGDRQRIPDAALLKPHDCISQGITSRIRPVPRRVLEAMSEARSPIIRLGGYSSIVKGFVSHTRSEQPLGGVLNRFPSCVVQPRRVWRYGIPTPFLLKRFSKKGDSGAWAVTQTGSGRVERYWIGMVVAGGKDTTETTVLLAGPLLCYFRNVMKDERPLAPFSCE